MKILWGPETPYSGVELPHTLVNFGSHGAEYKAGNSWEELFARLPKGFYPDLVVWKYPDTKPWPIIDDCPVPLVGILND